MNKSLDQGYIALTSIMIISVMLLTVTITLGAVSYIGRFSVLESEYKERSLALAEACVDLEILDLAQNIPFTGGPMHRPVGAEACTIQDAVQPGGPGTDYIIRTRAIFQKSTTNLEVAVDSANYEIQIWQECRNLPPPCD